MTTLRDLHDSAQQYNAEEQAVTVFSSDVLRSTLTSNGKMYAPDFCCDGTAPDYRPNTKNGNP